jgi:hypothetical protein
MHVTPHSSAGCHQSVERGLGYQVTVVPALPDGGLGEVEEMIARAGA